MTNPVALSVRLQNTLSQPSLLIRCQDISLILQEVSSKDASYILRTVVESIFGAFEESVGTVESQSTTGGGWGLRIITLSEHRLEFDALRTFLAPRGPLLNLIYKLSHDPYQLLAFPISLLPPKVRSEIQEGSAAAFYTNKIQNLGPGKSPMNIMLNAFEFYILHIGNFLVSRDAQRWNLFWTSVKDSLYLTLLEDYLSAFLPCDGSSPPGPTSSPVSHGGILSPIMQRTPFTQPFANLGSSITRPYRSPESIFFSDAIVPMQTSSPLHCHSVAPQSETGAWTSHIVIQVLMEVWINLCISPPKLTSVHHYMPSSQIQANYSFVSSQPNVNDVFVPSNDHVRAVRMLIKHFHYFANSLKPQQPTPLDQLRRNIWGMCCKSVYYFLRHLFAHWPLDSSFRLVLETWLSYIQPWRYVAGSAFNRSTPKQLGSEHEPSHFIDSKWKLFVAENFLFYSHLFSILLKRLLRLDISSPKNAQIVFRAAKVFAQEDLALMLHDIENLVETSQLQKTFMGLMGGTTPAASPVSRESGDISLPTPQTILQLVRTHILEVEKQHYHHVSVFGSVVPRDVYKLLKLARMSQEAVTAELQSGGPRGSKSPSGGWDWFTTFWKSIFDMPFREDENTIDEMQKCLTHLELSIKYFCLIFNIVEKDVSLLAISSELHPSSNDHSVTRPSEKTYVPEQMLTDVGPVLTKYGRFQLLNGMRRLDLKYEGDPDLKPISSYEVALLVRIFYSFCRFLNEKYEAELISLFYRRDFLGSIGRVFLFPPQTLYEYKKDSGELPYKRIARDIPPRIRLRVFAHKKVLLFFVLFYFVMRFLGVSFHLVVPFLVGYVVCRAIFEGNPSPRLTIPSRRT